MSDLRELYQELIIDHGRSPRHFHILQDATHSKEGFNPLCGDRLTLFLKLNGDIIEDVGFQGSGCAISMASASLMTDHIKGQSLASTKKIFELFHQCVTEDGVDATAALGKLSVLIGVREYPSRVKCATLAWHTLMAALIQNPNTVTTE